MMRKYVAELVASILVVYVVLATSNAFAIGSALALVLFLIKDISGGHVNPAVTIALASAGKFPVNEVIPYNVAQVFGGLIALEIYKRYRP